jgi:hypothetical protein
MLLNVIQEAGIVNAVQAFLFHKRRVFSFLGERLLASQGGCWSMELAVPFGR